KGTRSIDLAPLAIKSLHTEGEVVQGDRVVRAEVVAEPENAAVAAAAAARAQAFARLQQDGALRDQLAYAGLDELDLAVRAGAANLVARVPLADKAAADAREQFKTIKPEARYPTVTFDHVIGPDELEQELIPRLQTYPEVNAYVVGHTYRKRNVWA